MNVFQLGLEPSPNPARDRAPDAGARDSVGCDAGTNAHKIAVSRGGSLTRKRLLTAMLPAVLMAPKKALGFKRDLPKFQTGDVLTAEKLNDVVRAVNER